MAEIKQAEGYEAEMQGTSVRRSHTSNNNNASAGGAQVGMPWTGEADKAMKALADGTNSIVQLGIDIKDEKIILLNESKELNSLSLPSNDPSYTFYKHTTGIGMVFRIICDFSRASMLVILTVYLSLSDLTVFIYCCPDTSPIRGRMIYSSNCQPIVQDAKSRGVQVSKKVRTRFRFFQSLLIGMLVIITTNSSKRRLTCRQITV